MTQPIPFEELRGQTYGRWTVLDEAEPDEKGHRRVVVQCACGSVPRTVDLSNLRQGGSTSCGCARGTHHMSSKRIYRIWAGMIKRMTDPNAASFDKYGGGGLDMDPRWKVFADFFADMGEPPTKQHTLDRKDGTKGYWRDNCRWATPAQQSRNKQNNIWVTVGAQKMVLKDAARYLGMPYSSLRGLGSRDKNYQRLIDERRDALRKSGIGGSEAAAAIGLSPWATPYDLWCRKVGEDQEQKPSEPMIWGSLLQDVILDEYSRRTGKTITDRIPPLMHHPEYNWMIGSPDARVIDRLVEVKTARDARGWGEPGTDEVPLHYLLQCHHYLTISGTEIVDLPVLIGGSDFRIYTILHDDDIARLLIDQEAAFWRYVEQREPPPPIHLSDVIHRWGRLAVQGAVVADRIELLAIEELRRIREHRATLDAMDDANKAVVLQALSDKGEALIDNSGNLLATWKLDGGRKGYTVEPRGPARRFLLKG